jgi:hypothetical protein
VIRRVLRWAAIGVTALVVLVAVLWAYAARQPRGVVTTEEVVPPGEAAVVMRLVRKATAAIEERARPDGLYKRDAHAQPHGCVTGTFEVGDALDARYRQGVFRAPGRRYKAWVRFSNGTAADDTAPDARGMAIKLLGVRGTKVLDQRPDPDREPPEFVIDRRDDPERKTQDFVMVNYHTFFLRTVEEYEEFFGYQDANRPIAYFFAGPPWRWRMHALYHGAHMLFQRVPSPLATRYYSMSAYRFGTHNAKFSAQPCEPPTQAMPPRRGPNYLREALVRDLRAGDACFDFLVQVQDPTKNMPIEDPTIAWDEDEVPYVPVARLRIPAQEFSTDAQNRFCEVLQFAPWHALPEHRPLGSLNRARKVVYAAVSRRRHFRNQAPRGEPRGWCLHFRPCAPADELRPTSAGVPGRGRGGVS